MNRSWEASLSDKVLLQERRVMKRVKFTLCAAIMFLLQSITFAGMADAAPAISWSTSDNSIVSGAGVAYLNSSMDSVKWCLTVNGASSTALWPGSIEMFSKSYYDNQYYRYTNKSGNCWTLDWSGWKTVGSRFSFDSTSWADASYTFQVTVADAGNQAVGSSVLTFTTSNLPPTVSWSTLDNSVFTSLGEVFFTSPPDENGCASTIQWCLTVNG